MMTLKSARVLAASLGVLAVGAMAAPAMAFDKVDWDWRKDIEEDIDIDGYIDLDVEITGMVQVEKLQIFLGTLKAESTVYDISNNPFYEKGHGYFVPGKDKVYTSVPDYKICYKYYCFTDYKTYVHYKDGWDYIPVKPLDATTQLPIVLSSATAVGNNQSITSDVPVFLHDGQFVADVKDKNGPRPWDPKTDVADAWKKPPICVWSPGGGGCGGDKGGNAFVDLALDFLKDAKYGKLVHAEIEAKSRVYDIQNASVDSSATAVANNISVTLASDVDGSTLTNGQTNRTCGPSKDCVDRLSNHIVIADITQFALANVKATSTVYDVTATGYSNMRQLTTAELQTVNDVPNTLVQVPTPWISSVATAVGNNVSINVGRDLTN